MTNKLTQETGSVLLLDSTERKDDCHTLRTTSPLVSVLTEESSSTYYTYAHSHLFSYSYKDPPNSVIWSECRNSSLSHHCYLWIFCSLIYLRKHPESLFKAIWCTSPIGSNSPSFIVCWIWTKLVLSSHKYARMARGLVPPPQHSCL